MKTSLIGLLVLGSCVAPGSFCTQYVPLELTREGATALVRTDRSAAEKAAVNEQSYSECGADRPTWPLPNPLKKQV